MTPSLAVAISVYNRWEELGGLLELLRYNWQSGPLLHITVVTTAAEAEIPLWIDRSLITVLQSGSPYTMPRTIPVPLQRIPMVGAHLAQGNNRARKRALRTRTVASIIAGCSAGMNSGKASTLHLHAAAWPLKEAPIFQMLERMQSRGYFFAGRGLGTAARDQKRPLGDIDDNFFIIDNAFARAANFWSFDPAQDAETVSNEGRLARRVYDRCPQESIFLFDDFSDARDYIFPPGTTARRMQPFNYYKPMGLLRSHDLHLQAAACHQMKYSGPVINKIIKGYLPSQAEMHIPTLF